MKKLISTNYSALSVNISLFLLRVIPGLMMMIKFGYDKLIHFNERKTQFISFMGLSKEISLGLVVFAEFFCSFLIIIGLFSRFTVLPLVITMLVALFKAHGGDIFGDGEHAALYLVIFSTILFCGPGKFSVDGMIGK